MIVENLVCDDEHLIVGITELINEKKLGKDYFIKLSSKKYDNIEAVQFLNASLIAGKYHLLSAAQNALNARVGDYAISRSLDVEIIVYASAQRQIGRALDELGVHSDMETVAVVVIGKDMHAIHMCIEHLIQQVGAERTSIFASNDRKLHHIMEHFGVKEIEIRALTNSKKIQDLFDALTRCIVSRISIVALDS